MQDETEKPESEEEDEEMMIVGKKKKKRNNSKKEKVRRGKDEKDLPELARSINYTAKGNIMNCQQGSIYTGRQVIEEKKGKGTNLGQMKEKKKIQRKASIKSLKSDKFFDSLPKLVNLFDDAMRQSGKSVFKKEKEKIEKKSTEPSKPKRMEQKFSVFKTPFKAPIKMTITGFNTEYVPIC